MNVADSNMIASHLELRGLSLAESLGDAELVVINTCSVRGHAEHKALSFIGELQQLKVWPRVIVVGCAAQRLGETLKKRFPIVKLVTGAKDIEQFPHVFDRFMSFGTQGSSPAPSGHAVPLNTLVTVMRGCENFCSYCIVPYVRGEEKSRPPEEIISEITAQVQQGAREVMLLGQNVNSYTAGDKYTLRIF